MGDQQAGTEADTRGTAGSASSRVAPDWERAVRASDQHALYKNEADIVEAFLMMHSCGRHEDLIPCDAADSIVTEMVFKYGRADIVVFHADGTASVIEAKHGAKGYTHVVGGIGQACLYAAQLAMTKGAVRSVRKCLMWSSTGDMWLEAMIGFACEAAGVIPMPMGQAVRLTSALAAGGNRQQPGVSHE